MYFDSNTNKTLQNVYLYRKSITFIYNLENAEDELMMRDIFYSQIFISTLFEDIFEHIQTPLHKLM